MEEGHHVYDNPAFPDLVVNENGNTEDTRIKIFVVPHGNAERGEVNTKSHRVYSQCSSIGKKILARVYERRGLLSVAFSSLFFSFKYILINILSSSISSHQAVVMIMPVLLIASLATLLIKRIPPPTQPRRLMWLFISGFSLACYLGLFALSVTHIDVGDAVTILNTSLIFVGPLSWILLRERTLTLTDFVFALLAFSGVVFVARPPFLFGSNYSGDDYEYNLGDYADGDFSYDNQTILSNSSLLFDGNDNNSSTKPSLAINDDVYYYDLLWGTGLAFGASMCLAVLYTSVRKQTCDDVDVYTIMSSGAIIVMAVNALVCTVTNSWTIPVYQDWIYASLTGGSYYFAQSFLFLGLSLETATAANIVLTLEIVFTFVWQFVFFDVVPAWTSYAGTSCVLLACIGHACLKPKPDETSSNGSGADE